jgi:uncharacterized YigZ family protein
MQNVRSKYTAESSIKKSRFIGVIIPCLNEFDVADGLRECQALHPNASHITFAYRIKTSNGIISRFHDAGEPSGTAGKPIFQHLDGKDLVNVLLIVIRYFGGIKLGAGGLTRAYGNAARQVIEIAEIEPYVEYVQRSLVLDYKQLQTFEHDLNKLNGEITGQNFAGQIHLAIKIPRQNLNALSDVYAGLFSGEDYDRSKELL